jgi:hypothetical protein
LAGNEVNHPMYSTSIGLIINGYKLSLESGQLSKKQKKVRKMGKIEKPAFITSFLSNLGNMFEEKDEKMN